MENIDFSKVTACGENCTGCNKKVIGECEGCIETNGKCKEWKESNGCPVAMCAKIHEVQLCGRGIHNTLFKNNTFDIGSCIGVLEYFDKEYVRKALIEIQRILKTRAKFVLDIPNIEGTMGKMMASIENHIGRTDKFDLSIDEIDEFLVKTLL